MSEQDKNQDKLGSESTPIEPTRMRQVRSFVRREGRLTPKQLKALDQFWSHYGIDYHENTLLDLSQLFVKQQPIILEIGFGMGQSFLEMAQAQPQYNFMGIEVHRPGVGNVLSKLAELNLTNVKILQHDAVEILTHMLPDHSLEKIQIFFPDPWPKKKHHKRRIIQTDFVNVLANKLVPNKGLLHLATDWENYAEHMLAVCETIPTLSNQAGKNQYAPRPADRPLTKYEQRGQRLGHGVWDLVFVSTIKN